MPKSFEIDLRQLKKYEKDLKLFSEKAFLFAEKQTVNDAAFFAMKATKRLISQKFTTRNTFTERRIRVDKATNLNRPVAIMGSLDKYMVDQEFGGTRRITGRHGVAIPTPYASGEGESKKRLKTVRKRNRLSSIRLKKQRRSMSIPAMIRSAAKKGQKVIFLKLKGRKQGIFRLVGGKRKPKIKMLYDLSRSSIPVKKRPTLLPATNKAARRMPGFYVKAIKFQLRRRGMFVD